MNGNSQKAWSILSSSQISPRGLYQNGRLLIRGQGAKAEDFFESLYRQRGMQYSRFFKMDLLSKLGILAAEWLDLSSWMDPTIPLDRVGIVLSNAHASLDTDLKYYRTVAEIPSPSLFVYTLPNIVIGEIAIRHQFKGENAFFVFPKMEGAFLAHYVNNLINNNILQYCLCGWVDVLKDDYHAFLMLVGPPSNKTAHGLLLEEKQIQQLYQLDHG